MSSELSNLCTGATTFPSGVRADRNELWRRFRIPWLLAGAPAALVFISDAGRALAAGRWLELAVIMVAVVAWMSVAIAASAPVTTTVGRDGVRIGKRYYRYADIEDIERLRISDVVIKRRVAAALSAYRGSTPPAHHEELARADPEELAGLLKTQDYRAETLRAEDLEAAVDAIRAAPKLRIAAARALPKTEEARRRIAIAAADSADEEMRAALEAIAAEAQR